MGALKKIILGLLVIALPLGEVARLTFNEVAITILDIGVAITVLFWVVVRRKIPRSYLAKPITLFIAALLISLLVNAIRLNVNELFVSSLYLLRWVFYTLLYFVVLDLSLIRKKIERAIFIGGGIILLVGYILYFLYPDLRNLRYGGWDEHLYRLFSTFLDPNFAGSFLVLYFLFLIDKLSTRKNNLLRFISIATLIAIVLTFSRSAYVMLFTGIVILLYLKGMKFLAIGFIALFLVLIIITTQLSFRSEGTNLLRTASGEARLDSIKNAITIFKDHPIFGVGFNSYRYSQRDYGFLNEKKMIVHSGAGTDNSFLFILATSGVVGFGAFLFLLFKILSIKDSLIVASTIALFVNSLFINALFYPEVMLWMWVLLGLRENT